MTKQKNHALPIRPNAITHTHTQKRKLKQKRVRNNGKSHFSTICKAGAASAVQRRTHFTVFFLAVLTEYSDEAPTRIYSLCIRYFLEGRGSYHNKHLFDFPFPFLKKRYFVSVASLSWKPYMVFIDNILILSMRHFVSKKCGALDRFLTVPSRWKLWSLSLLICLLGNASLELPSALV